MIVADTNIISYLCLPTEFSDKASKLYQYDPEWIAPNLWRSEFRNVLALYLRQHVISFTEAALIIEEAEAMMTTREFCATSLSVLKLVSNSNCSAYDCEFVSLAHEFNIKLVTQDKKILREFSDVAISLDDYIKTF